MAEVLVLTDCSELAKSIRCLAPGFQRSLNISLPGCRAWTAKLPSTKPGQLHAHAREIILLQANQRLPDAEVIETFSKSHQVQVILVAVQCHAVTETGIASEQPIVVEQYFQDSPTEEQSCIKRESLLFHKSALFNATVKLPVAEVNRHAAPHICARIQRGVLIAAPNQGSISDAEARSRFHQSLMRRWQVPMATLDAPPNSITGLYKSRGAAALLVLGIPANTESTSTLGAALILTCMGVSKTQLDPSSQSAADSPNAKQLKLAQRIYSKAVEFLNAGNAAKALEGFDGAIKLDPEYAEAHCNRGVALATSGDVESAINSYRKAISLKPDLGPAYFNLAGALASQSESNESLKADALTALEAAFTFNFRLKAAYLNDPDLESVRDNSRFKNLVSKLR